jgi:hypothetical protein
MDQVRRDTINEWNSANANIRPIPYLLAREVLKDSARHNPWHNDKPNVKFQCDLNLMIEADREYLDNPTLSRLCAMFHWSERLAHARSKLKWLSPSPREAAQGPEVE